MREKKNIPPRNVSLHAFSILSLQVVEYIVEINTREKKKGKRGKKRERNKSKFSPNSILFSPKDEEGEEEEEKSNFKLPQIQFSQLGGKNGLFVFV